MLHWIMSDKEDTVNRLVLCYIVHWFMSDIEGTVRRLVLGSCLI